jgi:hypothetical protein
MKKNNFALVTLMLTLLFSSAYAQKNKQQTLDDLFLKNGEIYFSFQIFGRDEIPVLTKIISIDNVYYSASPRNFAE